MTDKERCIRFFKRCKEYRNNIKELDELLLEKEAIKVKQMGLSSVPFDKEPTTGSHNTSGPFNFALMDKNDFINLRIFDLRKENDYIDYVLNNVRIVDIDVWEMIIECYINRKPHRAVADKHFVSRSKMYRDMNKIVLPIIKQR